MHEKTPEMPKPADADKKPSGSADDPTKNKPVSARMAEVKG
jgi:hypothetical protein